VLYFSESKLIKYMNFSDLTSESEAIDKIKQKKFDGEWEIKKFDLNFIKKLQIDTSKRYIAGYGET